MPKDYQFRRPCLDHSLIMNMIEVSSGVLLIPSLNRKIWTLTMGQILKNYNCFTFKQALNKDPFFDKCSITSTTKRDLIYDSHETHCELWTYILKSKTRKTIPVFQNVFLNKNYLFYKEFPILRLSIQTNLVYLNWLFLFNTSIEKKNTFLLNNWYQVTRR